jgi:hypothetical protein
MDASESRSLACSIEIKIRRQISLQPESTTPFTITLNDSEVPNRADLDNLTCELGLEGYQVVFQNDDTLGYHVLVKKI